MTIQARNYAFTLNNYTDDDIPNLRQQFQDPNGKVRYAIFGYEISDTGTPHLQGYVAFLTKRTIIQVKRVLGDRAHIEAAIASEHKNRAYCSKDGQTEEFGRRSSQGKRSDLEAFKSTVKEGVNDLKRLREDHSEICAKYPRFVEQYLRDQKPVPQVPSHSLRTWQADLVELLKKPANDREVIFVVDQKGNSGKTWFSKYFSQVYNNSLRLTPSRKADMIYSIYSSVQDYKVYFIDVARSKMDSDGNKLFPYELMEELKNGELLNTKYTSEVFKFPVPHVVVLANEEPDMKMLSEDRYRIIHVD